MKRLSFTPSVGSGKLVVQKRPSYNIIQNEKPMVYKGKKITWSTSGILEERPNEPMPTSQRIENEQMSQIEEYSSTQSPLHMIGDEKLNKE